MYKKDVVCNYGHLNIRCSTVHISKRWKEQDAADMYFVRESVSFSNGDSVLSRHPGIHGSHQFL